MDESSVQNIDRRRQSVGIAFLLAQIGAHAAARFGVEMQPLGLNPSQAGILRLVAQGPGLSQQTLATTLGVVPSRVVSLIDNLEIQDLVERRRNSADRRNYALYLTDRGQHALADIGGVARQHEADITSGLTNEERAQLRSLLEKIASRQGLTAGVHPGYRTRKADR